MSKQKDNIFFTSLLIKQFLRYFLAFLSLFLLFQEVVGKGLLLYSFCIWKNFVSPLPSMYMDNGHVMRPFFKNILNNWRI